MGCCSRMTGRTRSSRRSSPGSTLTTAARSIATSCGPPLSSTPRSARRWASRSRPRAHLATSDEREREHGVPLVQCGQEPRRTHRTRVGTRHGARYSIEIDYIACWCGVKFGDAVVLCAPEPGVPGDDPYGSSTAFVRAVFYIY